VSTKIKSRGGRRGAVTATEGAYVDWIEQLDEALDALGLSRAEALREAGCNPGLISRMSNQDMPYGGIEKLVWWLESKLEGR